MHEIITLQSEEERNGSNKTVQFTLVFHWQEFQFFLPNCQRVYYLSPLLQDQEPVTLIGQDNVNGKATFQRGKTKNQSFFFGGGDVEWLVKVDR